MSDTVTRIGLARRDWRAYNNIHNWLRVTHGKANECRNIECEGKSERFEWSNISQEYKRDISDWTMLCVPCHRLADRTGYCRKGHEYTEENTYIAPKTGIRNCKTCGKINHANYRRRHGK